MRILVLVVFALAVGAAFLIGDRPRVRVRIEGGQIRVTRGKLPFDLRADLEAIAQAQPEARGRVELRGRGDKLDLRTPGLDETAAQRVRNVVFIRRGRL